MPHEGVVITQIIETGQPKVCPFVMSIVVYIPLVGLFRVARFDEQGNAKAYTLWNERQELAPRFFFCMG